MKSLLFSTTLIAFSLFIAACGGGATGTSMKTIAEKKVNDNLTVSIMNADGKLKNGEQDITLKFTDGSGNPVEIEAAALNFNMPAMGSMAEMNDAATLTTTGTPGEFNGKVSLQMAGEWQAQISYEGKESGKTSISTTAY
ncbi:MAG: FixH family protein [Acidobacteriota bacterium]|nr:FixH family protein [Acidobacteriota bacterium]